jgi:prephenate dehydrogenase
VINLQGKTVGVLGLGQVGGSLAWALKTHCPEVVVVAYDAKPELMVEAKERMILDRTVGSATELVEAVEIVVLALPIDGIIKAIADLGPALMNKTLVSDVGSIMKDIVDAAKGAGLTNYVSGHPLAGSEKRGAEAWDRTLFDGSNYFVTELADSTDAAKEALNILIKTVGATPVPVKPIPHDQAFATTSNIPHVVAFCLRRAYDRLSDTVDDKSDFSCPSFRGATRVASSDPDMVFQMLWHNRNFLAGALRSFASELEIVRQALVADDAEVFRQALAIEDDA